MSEFASLNPNIVKRPRSEDHGHSLVFDAKSELYIIKTTLHSAIKGGSEMQCNHECSLASFFMIQSIGYVITDRYK